MIAPASWEPAGGLVLEPNARRAATEQARCLALTAGPGAGKTEMLAQRADFLLRTGCCRYPSRILAISFKVDASVNLKERVHHRCGTALASRFDSYTFHAFAKRIIDRFRPLLVGEDALDAGYKIGNERVARKQITFRDLVPLALKILRQSDIARNAVRQTYSDVFLDEFQDCTNEQYELVKAAFQNTRARLTAVGDTKQKIMGWAGALDGIFERFAADFDAVPLNMYRNFRSAPELLRLQNEVIRVLDPTSVMPDSQLGDDGGEVSVCRFDDSRNEAEYLADQIENWISEELIPPSEIAVLVSKQLDLYANHLMQALEERGVPYRNEQHMQDIASEPAARLIVDYLVCLYGLREPKAWTRLTSQLSPFTDEYARYSAHLHFQRFFESERQKAASVQLIKEQPYSGWWEYVRAFFQKVGVEALVSLSPEYETLARLREVIQQTKQRIEELFAADSDLLRALQHFSDDRAVRLLTIHKSKGLEFDTVVILGVEEQTFWGRQDEERCAFFVGISRAKERLILTVSERREEPPSKPYRWREQRVPHAEFLGYALGRP